MDVLLYSRMGIRRWNQRAVQWKETFRFVQNPYRLCDEEPIGTSRIYKLATAELMRIQLISFGNYY